MNFIKPFLTKEFLLFLVIGVANTFNGTAFSWLYSFFCNPNLSFVFGYITALTISYWLHSRFNFRQPMRWLVYGKFCLSYVPNFLIQNVVVFLCYNLLGIHQLISYGLAAIVGIPVTFLLIKLFTFMD